MQEATSSALAPPPTGKAKTSHPGRCMLNRFETIPALRTSLCSTYNWPISIPLILWLPLSLLLSYRMKNHIRGPHGHSRVFEVWTHNRGCSLDFKQGFATHEHDKYRASLTLQDISPSRSTYIVRLIAALPLICVVEVTSSSRALLFPPQSCPLLSPTSPSSTRASLMAATRSRWTSTRPTSIWNSTWSTN
jgi:hypothetical protein